MHLGLAEFQSDVDLQTSHIWLQWSKRKGADSSRKTVRMYKGRPIKEVANIFLSFFNPLPM